MKSRVPIYLVSMLTCFMTCTTVLAAAPAAENKNDTYDYRTVCPKPNGGFMVGDKWGFYDCECTSYVASKLNKDGIKFNNTYKQPKKGQTWGGAGGWIAAANRANFKCDNKPSAGAVATGFSYAHVAFVESVSKKGDVTLSEYNYSPSYGHDYSSRVVSASSASKLTFIHIK